MAAAIVGRAAMRLAKKGLKKKAKKKAASSVPSYVKKTGKPESAAVSARKRRNAQDEIVSRRQGYGGYKAGDTPAERAQKARRTVEKNRPATAEARATRGPRDDYERMTPGERRKLESATKESAANRRRSRRRRRVAGGTAAAAAGGAAASRRRKSNSFSDPRGR